MGGAANSFWRYSLRTWRAPGVQESCLALQERCGADVNLLLFCGWTARRGRVLDREPLSRAMAEVGPWQADVIAPLRQARRGLKQRLAAGTAMALALPLRQRVAALELSLERVEQALLSELESTLPPPAQHVGPREAVAESLGAYLSLLARAPGPEEMVHVDRLIDGFSRS